MFYYFPTEAIIFTLIFDICAVFLLIMMLKLKGQTKVFFFFIVLFLLLPTSLLKFLSQFNPLLPIPGTLKVENNVKAFSPIYIIDDKGNVLWIFLTFEKVVYEQRLDIEGNHIGISAMKIGNNYTSQSFKFEKNEAQVIFNEDNLDYNHDGYIKDMLFKNLLDIILNYLSHLISVFIFLFLLSRIFKFIILQFKPKKTLLN